MRKNKDITKLFMIGVTGGLAGALSQANAENEGEMGTVPQNNVWVADGTTKQKLFVYVDNNGLNGEPTKGAQWRLDAGSRFTYVPGSSTGPSEEDDFFGEREMQWEIYQPPTGISSRFPVDDGPVNSNGYVGVFEFKTPVTTSPGVYQIPFFNHSSSFITDVNGEVQPSVKVYSPITVVRDEQADFDKDGHVDHADYEHFRNCITGPAYTGTLSPTCTPADFTSNGTVDTEDYAYLQEVFTGDELVE